MQTILYDGTFEGWLCAVFDVYDYRFTEADITTPERYKGNIFQKVHTARAEPAHAHRVRKGLERKLPAEAVEQVYRAFLSEAEGMENLLLRYVQYAFGSDRCMAHDFSHPAVLAVTQAAKKVWREQHRMEAFVRFQKTGDGLYYAVIEPDHNVLPLIAAHFESRYADQRWLIYDARRRYGIYFDGEAVHPVELHFADAAGGGKHVASVYDESETVYQQLWQQYFSSVNIPARKNTKLHIQHMPRRYWKYLPEKQKPG